MRDRKETKEGRRIRKDVLLLVRRRKYGEEKEETEKKEGKRERGEERKEKYRDNVKGRGRNGYNITRREGNGEYRM